METSFRWKARHTVLAVLFTTWIVSYLDRMVMSVAIPYIAKDFDLSPVAMGVVMSAFFAGYALCQIPGGMLADRFGSRRVMTSALVWWSAFTAFTGMASSLVSMLLIRVGFGIGEGVFPGGSWKSIAVWFPVKERATANAFMLSSNSLGPALAPLFVVAVMATWGWRAVFYSLFIPGLLVALLIWIFVTDKPAESKRVSAEELAEIQQTEPVLETASAAKVGFLDIIKVPVVWQCFIIWFAFDITLWGFMSWLPTYLVKIRGFELVKMGIAASLPFFAGTIGLIAGGWISDKFFAHSRKTPLIASQLLGALFLYLTYTVASADMAIIYQTLAGGFLFMAMGAFWALPMNSIPKSVMGVSSSFINTAGQIAGFLSPMIIGYLVQVSGGSFDTSFMFLIAGALISSLVATTVVEKKKQTIAA